MSRQRTSIGSFLATLGVLLLSGCTPTQPFYFHDDGDLSHYKDKATEIEYPDTHVNSLTEVECAQPPMTVDQLETMTAWQLTLEEAVQMAMVNSKVVRRLNGFDPSGGGGGSPDTLLAQGSAGSGGRGNYGTIYDPALVETDPAFGVEGALAAYDATLASGIQWQQSDQPQNVQPGVNGNFMQDSATYSTELAKRVTSGGVFSFRNDTVYTQNNIATRGVPSDYTSQFQAAVTQPLLRGAGTQFNRIAGPGTNANLGFGFGVYRGVVIARINSDITLADFEGHVQNLVFDVERQYRALYFLYRELDARKAGRDSALTTWRNLDEKFRVSIKGGEKLFVAKARAQYYQLRAQSETALWNLLNAETRLRYLLGLAPTDGRIIRPIDEPTTARVQFDWCEVQSEALIRQVNIRRQRWQVKKGEMELIAARNFLLPQLDGVARYRFLGMGDDLIGGGPYNGNNNIAGTGAFPTIGSGNYQEWDLGLTFSMNLGFRRELAAVRNKQLQIARERAILQEQELEATHMLSEALRKMDYNHALVQTNYNWRLAAKEEEDTAQDAVDAETPIVEGVNPIDQLLEAQQRKVIAEVEYYRALREYNVAITEVHLRKGSVLEYNNVYLSEGPWPCKAYFDARKRARERDAGNYIDYGFTRPQVISRGEYQQFQGMHGEHGAVHEGVEGYEGSPIEEIPLPAYGPEEGIGPGATIMESTEAGDEAGEDVESVRVDDRESRPAGAPGILRAAFAKSSSDAEDQPGSATAEE